MKKNTSILSIPSSEIPVIDTSKPFVFEPLYDYVLCELVTAGRSKGGIVLTKEAEQSILPRVRVLASGPGHYEQGTFVRNPLEVGDVVLLAHPDSGACHQYLPPQNGKTCIMTLARNVIAKVHEPAGDA